MRMTTELLLVGRERTKGMSRYGETHKLLEQAVEEVKKLRQQSKFQWLGLVERSEPPSRLTMRASQLDIVY